MDVNSLIGKAMMQGISPESLKKQGIEPTEEVLSLIALYQESMKAIFVLYKTPSKAQETSTAFIRDAREILKGFDNGKPA